MKLQHPRFLPRETPRPTRPRRLLPLVASLSLVTALPLPGATLSFVQVTGNSPTDYSSALSLVVVDLGTEVVFLQSMAGSPPGFINQFYVEDGAGLFATMQFSTSLSSAGLDDISYGSPANPANPPGINSFNTTFSLDASSPAPTHGINNNETGAFIAAFAPGITFAQVEQALESGDLRVALHLQGLDPNGSQSDSYLSQPPSPDDPPLPEPSALLLGILALGITTMRRRRG